MGLFGKKNKKTEVSSAAQSLIDRLGFDHRVFHEGTDYSVIMGAYQKSLTIAHQEGFIPVMVLAEDVLDGNIGALQKQGYSVNSILQFDMGSGMGKALLGERLEERIESLGAASDVSMEKLIGDFSGRPEGIDRYRAFSSTVTKKCLETILFYVPTKKPWEVVAYIPFGAWDNCPKPEHMMGVCRYWFEKYGAIPATIAHDKMEMRVPRPIARDVALEVAKEHYAFAPDRVEQHTSTSTISELAAVLSVSKIWYFWWD